jgi:HlyD family secretion protein
MTKPTRRLLLLAGALGLALLVVQALRPDPVLVETDTVVRGPLAVTVDEEGRTRNRERYSVAAPVTGRLLRTEVEEGTVVKKGQVLVRLLPPPEDARTVAVLEAEVAAARARRSQAEARLAEARTLEARARSEAARRERLHAEGVVSAETHEQFVQAARAAEAGLATAHAALMAAQAEVERVQARLLEVDGGEQGGRSVDAGRPAKTVSQVVAPIDGVVLAVREESERVVTAGTPLFELGDPRSLEIVVDLLTEQAVRVRPGAPVLVTGWGGDQALRGRVRQVEPLGFTEISALGVEEQRVNVLVDLDAFPEALGAGFRVDVAIQTWRSDDVLTVATSAIFRRDGAWWAFTVEAGKAKLAAVELGHRSTERAEVLGGLVDGTDVVVYPSDLVEDGVRIERRGS